MLALPLVLVLAASPDGGARRPLVDQLLAKVKAGTVDTEAERDRIKPEDIPHLAKAYPQARSWSEKTLLVQLVQDSKDPVLDEVWWDALDVPDCPDDACWEVRAIALAHLDGSLERFSKYYDDRKGCREALTKRLAERARRRPKR